MSKSSTFYATTVIACSMLVYAGSIATASAGGLITIIVNNPTNPFWKTEGDVASAEAKKLGYETSVSAHKGDTNAESSLVDAAIAAKSVAIILDPADSDGSIAAVKKATAANIPVILVNAVIEKAGLAKAQLISNNAQGAVLGAQQWLKSVGTKGKYAELLGAPTDNNAATRSNGYHTVIDKSSDLVNIGSQVADWDFKEGHDKMQVLLDANPDLQGVIAGNDTMALGAIAALKESGKLAGVKVGGFDGGPDAVAAIKAGELDYTVLQPVAIFAAKAVDEADSFIKTGKTGASSEKQIFDCMLINKDNLAKYTSAFTLAQ